MASSAPLVIGTAGHIDHGKTALVRALTHTDTDRLPEEQRRGITIELGFAHLRLPSGREAAVVDVPGHERFVRHMVAGAAGIDLVLLVVAADDGVMEQTREHLEVCELLGCTAGVVAITKADLADDDWLDLVEADVRDTLAPTCLADAPIVRCSAATGAGLDELLAALDRVAATTRGRTADRPFRLPIDRCFTVRGFGTVVTGTVADGVLEVGDRVVDLPGGGEARVRGIERHNRPVERVVAGERAAVNLAGLEGAAPPRGSWLCHPATYEVATRLTVEVTSLARTAPTLTGRLPLHLHLGAADLACRLHPLEGREVGPGTTALAQLTIGAGVMALPGDHFVLRTPSPAATVGGGRVLAVGGGRLRPRGGTGAAAVRPLTTADPEDRLAALLALAGRHGIAASRLPFATGLPLAVAEATARRLVETGRAAVAGDLYFDAAILPPLGRELTALLARLHSERPYEPAVPTAELLHALRLPLPELLDAVAAATAGVVADPAGVRLATHRVAVAGEQAVVRDRLLALLAETPYTPPALSELARRLDLTATDLEPLVAHLTRTAEVVRIGGDRVYLPSALAEVEAATRAHLAAHGALTVADFKGLFSLTRRHAIPLLEHLDRTGITRREGEIRCAVPGR